ncbi:30S ribosomal protein S19 [Candidatus Norongarragalina meridionalis]|nr:30S ribosomal protein S19 [Candidatus Norongarragalina meridionalis]
MAKKFTYRGLEVEELQKMPLDDFIKIVPAKTRRSLKRMGYKMKTFIEKLRAHKKKNKQKPLRTQCREMVVIPEMIGMRVQVHAGNVYTDLNISPEMLGHRLGEYAITCKSVRHSGPGIGATRGSKAVELK